MKLPATGHLTGRSIEEWLGRIRAKHYGYFPKPLRPLKGRGFPKRKFQQEERDADT